MLVVPFAMRNGSNEHFAKTNRLPACCLQNCLGGPFFLGLAPARNAPTRIGSGWTTNCGSTSTTASRRQPANVFLTSVPTTNARRPPARRLLAPLNAFLTNKLPSNARRLCFTNASSTRRLLVANALPMHDRWRQPESSSCGFAVDASTPGSLARLCGDSNVRPLMPSCDMSRNAACVRQWWMNGNDRRRPGGRKRWPRRPMSDVARRRRSVLQRRRRWRWPRNDALTRRRSTLCYPRQVLSPLSNVAMRRPLALQHRRIWHLPRSGVSMRRRQLLPRSDVATRQPNKLQCWQNRCLLRSNVATRWHSLLRCWWKWH
jgi:hypothetical protein